MIRAVLCTITQAIAWLQQYALNQLAGLGRLYASIGEDDMNSPYHLNRESTLVAASGQPQMNRAAAKASAHDSLHGLPASSANVISVSQSVSAASGLAM